MGTRRLSLLVLLVVAAAACALLVPSRHAGRSQSSDKNRPSALRPSSTAAAATPRRSLVGGASWVRAEPGFRLVVRPTSYGRLHAVHATALALRQALASARPSPVTLDRTVRDSLHNQLRCHAVFASSKPTWDLETFRPDVGYDKTVLALCNP